MLNLGTRHRSSAVGALAAASVCLLLAACSSSSSGTKASSPAPSKLTFGVFVGQPAFLPYFVAKGLGYLDAVAKQDGVDSVGDLNGTSGTQLQSALTAGQVNWLIQGSGTVFGAVAQGGPPVVATQVLSAGAAYIVVGEKKYETSRGADISKYSGGKFGFTTAGSAGEQMLQAVTTHAGLKWGSSTHPVALGSETAILPALQAGRIDIAAMGAADGAQAVKLGVGYQILNMYQPSQAQPIIGNVINESLYTTQSFASKYPKLTKDVANAIAKASNYILAHIDDPATLYAALPPDYKSAQKEADFATSWAIISPSIVKDPKATSSQLNDTLKYMQATNAVPATFTQDQVNQVFNYPTPSGSQ
jgi:NitT/TauT family transport system substrate-binding protein